MDEAEKLCDRIAIMNEGKIVSLDTPQNLIRDLGKNHKVAFDVENNCDISVSTNIPGITRVERKGSTITVFGNPDTLISNTIAYLNKKSFALKNLHALQPNLEDVFLTLTEGELGEEYP